MQGEVRVGDALKGSSHAFDFDFIRAFTQPRSVDQHDRYPVEVEPDFDRIAG